MRALLPGASPQPARLERQRSGDLSGVLLTIAVTASVRATPGDRPAMRRREFPRRFGSGSGAAWSGPRRRRSAPRLPTPGRRCERRRRDAPENSDLRSTSGALLSLTDRIAVSTSGPTKTILD